MKVVYANLVGLTEQMDILIEEKKVNSLDCAAVQTIALLDIAQSLRVLSGRVPDGQAS